MDTINTKQEREIGTMAEQIKGLNDNLSEFKGEIRSELKGIRDDIRADRKLYTEQYVSKNEFTPVKNIVYSAVGLVLTGVGIALLALIVQ